METRKLNTERADGRTESLAQEFDAWLEDMSDRFALDMVDIRAEIKAADTDGKQAANARLIAAAEALLAFARRIEKDVLRLRHTQDVQAFDLMGGTFEKEELTDEETVDRPDTRHRLGGL